MTAASNSGKFVDFDEYVGLKLEKTRSTIRTTDVLTALAGVGALFLGYLLLFVVLDQWVIRGGFNVFWRWVLLSTLMISTIAWLVYKVGVPSFRTVNELFAAREIEKAQPELKSNLLNLIDLKEAGRQVNPQILKSIERQAAVRLQTIDVAQVIDHRPLIHAAYFLLAVIVAFCCYALLSPKKISNSIWRGLLPAAQVPLATVTEIIDVKPGDLTVPAHQQVVNVQVDLAGEIPAQVLLLYTTADGKQDQPVELRTEQEGQPRFVGQIIGDNTQGLTHDLSYFIRAGDATSRTYKITVEQPPYADVENVKIEFPPYMKLEPVEQQKIGAIDAWEGARVTLTAKTNMPVRSGLIQFLDDPTAAPTGEEVVMATGHQGTELQANWTLTLRSDGSYPKYYRIHCKTEDGRATTGHVIHPLTIRPDLPPEVVLLQPDRDVEAPANATIPLLIQARDPDFELGYVYLNVEKSGQKVLRDKISDGRQSKLTLKHDLELPLFNPVVGETFEFWIEAYDNKQPRPNSRNTPKVKILIVAPVSQKEAEKQLADQKGQRDQKLAEAEQEMNADRREQGQQREGNPQDQKSRDSNAAKPNEADPAKPENSQEQQPQNGQQDAQQSKKQNPSGNQEQNQGQGQGQGGNSSQSSRQNNTDQGQNGTSGKQSGEGSEQNKPLKNDGSQDDEALRRISERMKKNQSQKPSNSRDQSSSDSQSSDPAATSDKAGQKNKNSDQNQQPSDTNPQKDPASKTGREPANEKTGDRPSSDSQNPSGEGNKPEGTQPSGDPAGKRDADNPAANKPDMKGDEKNLPDKSVKESGDQKTEAGSKGDAGPKEDKKAGPQQPSNDPNKNGESGEKPSQGSEKGKSDQTDPARSSAADDKQSKPEGMKDNNPAGAKPDSQAQQKTREDSAENASKKDQKEGGQNDSNSQGKPSSADKPSSEMKEKSGQQASSGKNEPGKNESSKSETGKGETGQSEPGKSESGKPNGQQADSDPKATGQKQQTSDSPDARKKKADGTEEGVAKPDRDPNSQPTPSKNENLKRDPNEKPETRPGEQTSDPTDMKKDKPDSNSESSKDQGGASGKKQSSDNKTGDPSGSKSQQSDPSKGEQAGSENKSNSENSKASNNGKKSDQSREMKESQPSGESGANKPESGENVKKQSGQAGTDSKPDMKSDENNSDNQKGGQESPSGQQKRDGQKPGGASFEKNADDSQKSAEKSSEKSKTGEAKSKSDNASNENQEGESGSKSDSSQSDKKNSSKSESKSGDEGQSSGQKGDTKGKSDKEGSKQDGSKQSGGSEKGGSEKASPSSGKGDKPGDPKGKSATGKPSANGSDTGPTGTATQEESMQTRGGETPEVARTEEANLEYNRQATELILQKLKKDLERGEADQELLKDLGWTPEEAKRFADRMSKSLNESKQIDESPEGKARQQQFQEMLKSLDLQSSGNRRSGQSEPKRDVNQIESKRSQPPAAYRSVFEKFTKDLAKQKPQPKDASGK